MIRTIKKATTAFILFAPTLAFADASGLRGLQASSEQEYESRQLETAKKMKDMKKMKKAKEMKKKVKGMTEQTMAPKMEVAKKQDKTMEKKAAEKKTSKGGY